MALTIPLQLTLLCLTLSLNTLSGVSTEYGWRVSQWNPALFLTITELLKWIISAIFHIRERRAAKQPTIFSMISLELLWDTRHYGIPSALYFVNNNLNMWIFFYLPSHIVVMTYNLKIVALMIIATYFLKQTFSLLQWLAGITVLAGVCIIQYSPGSSDNSESEGISIVLITLAYGCVNAVLSGSAGTYCEYLYKFIEKEKGTPEWQQSIHVQNMKLYSYGILLGLAGFFASGQTLNKNDGAYEFHWIHVVILACGTLNGLVIGAIMKYLDNVVRSIMGALSLITAAAASSMILGNELTFHYMIGSVIVIVGAQTYVWGRRTEVTTSNGDANDRMQKMDVEMATPSPADTS